MQIPWWLKIGAKLVLSRLPVDYAFWQRLRLFRHGDMDSSEYAIEVFDQHVGRAGCAAELSGKTVLELGPGDSVATAVIAAAHGARALLVDSGRFSRSDIQPYRDLGRALIRRGLTPPTLSNCHSLDDLLRACDSTYISNGIVGLRNVDSESVDLIFSQAVLEHIRRREFLEMMQECRRVLRRNGVCSHTVDLRDHLGGALNNLRFSERLWESEFFVRSGFYTNRISFESMKRIFKTAGFEVVVDTVRRWDRLPTPRQSLSKEFLALPDEELCVSGFQVILR